MADIIESYIGCPCACGCHNPMPYEALTHDWQVEQCGGTGCNRKFEFRGWHRPTESDRENFVIQSRPFPPRINGRFAGKPNPASPMARIFERIG